MCIRDRLRDYLINYSRSFIYTTALPLPSVLAMKKAHTFLEKNIDRIENLKELIAYFKASTIGFEPSALNSRSAIQCIIVPGNDAVKTLAENIQNNGFDVRPILSPTVPKGQERLRICIHTYNTKEQIDGLLKAIEQ